MARPGYGVWDLDFSPYIVALSTVDRAPTAPWPTLPRASVGPMDGLDNVLQIAKDPSPSPQSEEEEVLVSPSPLITSLEEEMASKIPLKVEEPVSSFRHVKATSRVWEESSDEEDDEDNAPLATMITKRVASSSNLVLPRQAEAKDERSRSTPTTKRVSIVIDKEMQEAKQRKIMDEVARARERRQANTAGELERLAEAEKRRQPSSSYKRSSTMSTIDTSRRRTSASSSTLALQASTPSSPPSREGRRRTQSSYDMKDLPRPETSRTPSAPEGLTAAKRYHSFYELPKPTGSVLPPQMPQMAHLTPQVYMPPMYPAYPHPGMQVFPSLSPSPSMMFPQGYMQPMLPQHGIIMQQPMMPYGQQPSPAMYLQMQGRGNRSSLSVSDARQTSRSKSTHQSSSRTPRPSRIA